MPNKTIIIRDSNDSIYGGLKNVYPYCRSYNIALRAFRKATKRFKISLFEPLFYGEWRKELKNCELVILLDNNIEYVDRISGYIKHKNPNVRLVFWYWNPMDYFLNKVVDSKFIDEIWTYNRFDAKKYGLKYNTQCFRLLLPIDKDAKIENDMIFLGLDKGRNAILNQLRKDAESQDLKCDFYVVRTKKDKMDYLEYLDKVIHSRCVVDLVPNQRCGLTRRPLEALFYEKKIITNYEDIVNFDFYSRQNVFIIGKDDVNKLADFINSPYKKVPDKIVKYYSYDSWLKRIEKNESLEP